MNFYYSFIRLKFRSLSPDHVNLNLPLQVYIPNFILLCGVRCLEKAQLHKN